MIPKKSFILLIIAILGVFIIISILREPYENDRMPDIVTPLVKQEIIKEQEYEDKRFQSGVPCPEKQNLKQIIKTAAQTTTGAKDFPFCSMFKLQKGDIFLASESFDGGSIIYLFLQLPNGAVIDLLKSKPGYPGFDAKGFKTDGKSLVFQFEGWKNPRKYIELSLVK